MPLPLPMSRCCLVGNDEKRQREKRNERKKKKRRLKREIGEINACAKGDNYFRQMGMMSKYWSNVRKKKNIFGLEERSVFAFLTKT
jgi:hypothetical protein